mmetsp:Transcript_12078/g.13740  ORF Transcript_12078/g.13740 Transcript_12078/m.13740 type:complete len:80 (-) Transcript_12078:90-329(-)
MVCVFEIEEYVVAEVLAETDAFCMRSRVAIIYVTFFRNLDSSSSRNDEVTQSTDVLLLLQNNNIRGVVIQEERMFDMYV